MSELEKSGQVDWFGELPDHWESRKFSFDFNISNGQVDPTQEPYKSMTLIAPNHIESGTGRITELQTAEEQGAKSGKYVCQKGDIIYSKIRPELAKVTIAPEKCLCSADMYPIDSGSRYTNKFVYWMLLSDAFTHWVKTESERVAMPKINRETLSRLTVPAPPIDEQSDICDFLDQKSKKIDELHDTCENLLGNLDERKTAEITAAIIEGTDGPTVTKQPNTKWFDEIPAHWDVLRLDHLRDPHIPIVYGIVQAGPEQEEGVPIIKGGDCKPEKLHPDKLAKTTQKIADDYERSKLQPGELVYEIRGSIGRVVKVPSVLEGANLTQDTARIAPKDDVCADWLLFALQSEVFKQQMDQNARGAAVRGVNLFDLRRGLLPVPPKGEQQAIASYLSEIEGEIESLYTLIESLIELLREQRKSIITKTVTGDISVDSQQSPENISVGQ